MPTLIMHLSIVAPVPDAHLSFIELTACFSPVSSFFTKKTKAVVPVHFAGLPVDVDAIRAAAPGAFVLEDGAHAIGTMRKGKQVGPTRDAAAFSFHPIKNVTTGEGGAITTDSDELARKPRARP